MFCQRPSPTVAPRWLAMRSSTCVRYASRSRACSLAVSSSRWESIRSKIGRRHSAPVILQLVTEALAFGQSAQSGMLDIGNMNEDILAANFGLDKAEAFLGLNHLTAPVGMAGDLRKSLDNRPLWPAATRRWYDQLPLHSCHFSKLARYVCPYLLDADDVAFPQYCAALHLDNHDDLMSGVLDPVDPMLMRLLDKWRQRASPSSRTSLCRPCARTSLRLAAPRPIAPSSPLVTGPATSSVASAGFTSPSPSPCAVKAPSAETV